MASAMPDLPDPVCGGCHQELDEESSNAGTFISFANSLWHLDCFRCAKCNNKVTTGQDDLLLLSDGHPICSDCSYTCQVCHLPILEEAILTGDEAYHASCFTCRVCTKRIEELVFAKTSQGIYCMDCHHQRVERSKRHAEAKKAKAAAKAAAAAAAASGTSATLKPSSSSSSLKPDSRSAPRERSASVAPTTEPASTTSSPADKSGHRKASVASVASAASSPLLSTLSLGPDGGKASSSTSPSSRPKPLRPLSLTRNHSGAGASLSPSHPSPIPSLKLFPAEEGDAQDADSGRKNRSASARANSIPSPPSSAPAHITTTAAAAAASANSTPPQGSSSSLRSTSPRIDTTPVSRGSRPSSLRTTSEDDGSTTRRGSSPGSSSAVSNTNTLSPSPDHAPTSRRTSANGRQNRNSAILGISGLNVTATGGSGGDRLSKTYSFYDPDFVNLMDSIGKLGSEDSDFSLTLPASGHDEGDATIPPATKPAATASGLTKATGLDAELARRSAFDRDEHDEDDGLGADDAEADRRMTLKPGSLAGYPVFSKLASGAGAADSESAATGLGSIPSASASMESFSLFDGYESTDSTSFLDDPSSSSRYLRTHSRSNTSDSHSLNADENGETMEHLEGGAGPGESRSASALGGRIGSRRPSFAKSSSASSVLYSGSAVSEAEQRIRERADSAAKLMSRTRNGSTGSGGGGSHPPRAGSGSWFLSRDSRSGSLSAAESDLEADQGAPSTSVSGSSLTRDGTLRASSGGGKDAATTTTSRRGHQATGSTSGLNSYPLRKLSQRVKDKMPNLRSGKSSTGSNASGGAGSGSAPSAATAAAAKELIQLEPDLVEALLAQLDQARDQMESMQGKYNGMKRASRMAAHGYNVASQKFEVELNARYEAEVEMAALKRKLAEQTSKLTAVTGEAKRNEALMRRSQDVRSMVADMERSLAKLTVERDVRMAELAHLTATGVPSASAAPAGASSTTSKGKGDEDEAEEKEEKVKDKAGKENKDSTTASATSSGYFKDSLSPALISPPASISAPIGSSNPLLSPLLSAGPAKSPLGSAGAKASANGQQHADVTVSNLASRLESVKEKYKREIDDLVVERDSLLIEIEELRHNRDVFVNEGQALNARNEELSAQLNLLLKRLELGRQQEAMAVAAAATKARLGKKELPSVKGAAGGGSSSNGFFGGGGSKHRQHNSISSAAELANAQQQQQGGPNQMHPSSSGSNTAIARPVRVGKAEQPVVKKFKWMKASAKTVSVGIAAAIPGAGSGNNSNSNSSNQNGSGSNGVPNGHVGLGPNGGPVGSPSAMNGHGPGVGSPAMGGGGSSVGGSNEGSNANGQQQQQQQQQDGIVVREHLFQPFNILRPIRCFACQKNMWGQTEVRCALCGQSCHHKCLQNLPTSCLQPFSRPGDEPTEPAGPSMFGRDLVEQASAEGREVPEIVEKCVAAVEASGMDYEGIYRKSGGTSQLRVITQLFERGQPFDLQDMDRFNDVSAITSVLKNYFRELPVPLLTFDLHEAFIGVAEMRVDYEQKMERMADLIAQLPNVHFWTLRCLIVHLHRVQSRSDENRMSSRNLGVVFGPTLMRSSDTSREFAQMGGKAMTIEFFIDNPSLFSV
ncbi:Rho-type gtpase-activating protein [Tilletia horrida]|nr:Rho-type gtpase-activating protein [Tilletia horrida]